MNLNCFFGCVIHFSSENYTEALNDAKTAIDLQPSFVKAFVRGMSTMGQSILTAITDLLVYN